MMSKPDGDKLVRAMFDAFTNVLYVDDSRVVAHSARSSTPTESPAYRCCLKD